jgi:hypothetical protein
MATLTYDPTPADQPEFTEDEQNSIEVGEQLAQQQEQLLAGKYRNAQELEKAYMELQGKLGSPQEDSPEQEVEQVAEEVVEEQQEEQQEEVEERPYVINEESLEVLMNVAGGQQQYDEMLKWASDAFSKQEVSMYDHVMESGDAAAAMFAIQALKNAYRNSTGFEGQMLTGKAAPEQTDAFRSQAEVIQAMSDPRYDKDPAYRQDIFEKLDRSNIQF